MSLNLWNYQRLSTANVCPGPMVYLEDQFASGKGSADDDNSHIERVFYIDGDNLTHFLDDILGYATYSDSIPGYEGISQISRVIPQVDALLYQHFAMSASWEQVGTSSTSVTMPTLEGLVPLSEWAMSKVSVDYRPLLYQVLTDEQTPAIVIDDVAYQDETARFCTRSYNFLSDYLSAGPSLFKFVGWTTADSVAVPLDGAPGGSAGYLEYTIDWNKIPANVVDGSPVFIPPNQQIVLDTIGTVNETEFDGQPAGTCLMIGAEARMIRPTFSLSTASYHWNVKYKFIVRNYGQVTSVGPLPGPNGTVITSAGTVGEYIGPNFIYNFAAGPRWNKVTTDGTAGGNSIYSSSEHNRLFVPDFWS